jgi:two-component system NtrC family response regulator
VDVRVVSATNQHLQERVASEQFRADLFYRLNTITMRIPPLRDRGSDAILLGKFFLGRFSQEYGRPIRGFTDDAMGAIGAHSWPGNIRELENRIKRAVLMSESHLISSTDLELTAAPEDLRSFDLRDARARAERDVIQRALARSDGRLSAAARLLGVSRPTLYTLLDTHGLSVGTAGEASVTDEPQRTQG